MGFKEKCVCVYVCVHVCDVYLTMKSDGRTVDAMGAEGLPGTGGSFGDAELSDVVANVAAMDGWLRVTTVGCTPRT